MDLEVILERVESPEFKSVAADVAEELWQTIMQTITDQANSFQVDLSDNWERFYLPALRHGILRRLAAQCGEASEGWYETFCNAVREANERG